MLRSASLRRPRQGLSTTGFSLGIGDTLRPRRTYFDRKPHSFDIPVCRAMRSILGWLVVPTPCLTTFGYLVPDMQRLAELVPQIVAELYRLDT